jgi:hypothetical protein
MGTANTRFDSWPLHWNETMPKLFASDADWIDKADPTLRRAGLGFAEDAGKGPIGCTALKADGTRCGAPAMVRSGYLTCRCHGRGKFKVKIGKVTSADPRSRALPKRLMEKYEEACRDPELLSSRSDVAMLEARLLELTERLSEGESGQLWRDLKEAVERFDDQSLDRDTTVELVKSLVAKGCADEEIWRQLHDVIEQKTKVSAHEWKRLVDMRQVITAEKAVAWAQQVIESVLRHVPEDARRKKIAREIQGLMMLKGEEFGPVEVR